MQAQLKEASKKLESYSKITDSLKVTSLPVDLTEIGTDTLKINKQNLFVKGVSGDIYIDETVRVMNNMIAEKENQKNIDNIKHLAVDAKEQN